MSPDEGSQFKSISFYKSMRLRSDTPIEPLPEIAFAGKSNSGKSSLINYLAGRKKLAYVGKQPGKTRLINYFVVDGSFYLVDLPGYGYAKVSKEELAAWSAMMGQFFEDSASILCGIVLCTDIRRDPSGQDVQMLEWAAHYDIPVVVAATKADKIARSKRAQAADKIARFLAQNLKGEQPKVVPVSSQERFGAAPILGGIRAMLPDTQESEDET